MSIRRLTEDSYKVRLFNGDGPFVAHRTLTDGIEPSLQSLIDAYGIDNDDVVPQPAVIDSGEMVVQEAVDALQEAVDAIQLEVDAVGGRNIQDLANVSLNLKPGTLGDYVASKKFGAYSELPPEHYHLHAVTELFLNMDTLSSWPAVGETVTLWVNGVTYTDTLKVSKAKNTGTWVLELHGNEAFSAFETEGGTLILNPDLLGLSDFVPLADGDVLMAQDGELKPVDLPALIEAGTSPIQEAVDAIQLEVDAVGGRNIQDLANVSLHLSGTPTGALGGLVRTATYINISAGLFYWSLGGPSDWWMSVNTAQSQPWWDSIGVGDTVNLWVDGTVYAFPVLSKYTTNGNNAVKMGEKSLASGLDLNNAVVTIEPNYDDPSNFAPLVDGDTLMMQDGKLKPVDLPALIEAAFVARGL